MLFIGGAYSATLSPTQSVGSPFETSLKLVGTAGEQTIISPTLEVLAEHHGNEAELYALAMLNNGFWFVKRAQGWTAFSGDIPTFKTVKLGQFQHFDLSSGPIHGRLRVAGERADIFYGYRLTDQSAYRWYGNGFQLTISETARKLQDLLDNLTTITKTPYYDHLGIPGVVLAITIPGEGEWVGVSGVSDLENQVPMDAKVQFRIGSVTKMFTAMLILQLAEENKLTLDDSVAQWLPGMLPNGHNIKIRHLLNHTSGIGNFVATPSWNRAYFSQPDKQWTPEQLVQLVVDKPEFGLQMKRKKRPLFATIPGKDWYYSSTGYIVLGLIAEKATGETWENQIHHRFIDKLNLKNTLVPTTGQADIAEISDHVAHGYWNLRAQITKGQKFDPKLTQCDVMEPSLTWASGNMISTVADLKRWMTAIVRGELLNFQSEEEQLGWVIALGGMVKFGLGIAETPKYGIRGHRGQIAGFEAGVFYDIDADAVLVAFANRTLVPHIKTYIVYPALDIINRR